jgi:hypothetical protein
MHATPLPNNTQPKENKIETTSNAIVVFQPRKHNTKARKL